MDLLQNELLRNVILAGYFGLLSVLSFYGLHRYQLVYLYYKHRHKRPRPQARLEELPRVTIQLPIYNEVYVVERLIDSICALDYPKDRLQIQVLDDSNDRTQQLAARKVQLHAAEGFDIEYVRRPDRRGFKAGALQYGLESARGDFIAIFDADFLPRPEMLRHTLDYFSDSQVGMVQVRWDHLNWDYSLLTRVQSVLLDGHFVLESGTRNLSGRFFNFNGTAGVWRREAIEQAGGWQHDTLTEDLDLSYRAQLKGWKFVFLSDFTAPAEIPVDMNSFKSQQFRWAKGSIQTARKTLPRILRADLPARLKLEAFYHLTANINYPLMILLSLLLFPALVIRFGHSWLELLLLDLPLFVAATLSFSSFYLVAQREIYPDWLSRIRVLPLVLGVGIGLSINNARAVLEGLFKIESPFVRTPKFSICKHSDGWAGKLYRTRIGWAPLVEVAFGLYYVGVILYAIEQGYYPALPFLLLFAGGYLYTGLLSIAQPLRPLLAQRAHS